MNQPPAESKTPPPRRRRRWQRRSAPGASPGTLIADPAARRPVVRVIAYGPTAFEERRCDGIDDIRPFIGRLPVVWIDVEGLGDVALIEAIGGLFGLHGLALEDVVNTHQRPKLEEYSDHLFVVGRLPVDGPIFETEQIALFVGRGYLLTFHDRGSGACLEPVRERLRRGRGQARSRATDYLAYALLDAVIDAYFPALEHVGERIEALEDALTATPDPSAVHALHGIRRELLTLRRAIWPLRDVIGALTRDPGELIAAPTRLYLRDCYDHLAQIMDMVEVDREITASLIEIYATNVGNRMNEIMQVLTVIATIFIPISFVAGVYGMNFDRAAPWNMPELGWAYGYPAALALMALIASVFLVYFWRKGWLGDGRRRRSRTREQGRNRIDRADAE
ncbi:MAG: magnesium/cobalt transporter CorA [Alphaproteobacteria bacterium]|nr:magnesium/cobalt transporter CorA [Alphaproteobacteria bacterium]